MLHAHPLSLSEVWATFRGDGIWQIDFLYDLDALMVGVPGQPVSPEESERLRGMSSEEKARRLNEARGYFTRFLRVYFDGKAVEFKVNFPDIDEGISDTDAGSAGSAALRGEQVQLPARTGKEENHFKFPSSTQFGQANSKHGGRTEAQPTPEQTIALPGQKIQLLGRIPQGAKQFSFRCSSVFGQVILKLRSEDGGMEFIQPLGANETSKPFPFHELASTRPSRISVFSDFLVLGYKHIIPMGLDHVLFVIGLFLLSAQWRPVLWQVTAFTLAHSVTLALSMYGLVSLPARVIEPLIALSIALIAVENLFTAELKPWRPAVVFSFGLLHGMGFAGALAEANLPKSERLTGLIAFNGGVELGQLTVIALAFLAVGAFRKRSWYRTRVVIPGSLAIAVVGLYWAVQRVLA